MGKFPARHLHQAQYILAGTAVQVSGRFVGQEHGRFGRQGTGLSLIHIYCFGCQADGDVIDFTARLFGLNKKEASLKLAEDCSVSFDAKGHDPPRRRPVKRKISEELRYRQAEQKCFRVLCDYLHLLEQRSNWSTPRTTAVSEVDGMWINLKR